MDYGNLFLFGFFHLQVYLRSIEVSSALLSFHISWYFLATCLLPFYDGMTYTPFSGFLCYENINDRGLIMKFSLKCETIPTYKGLANQDF